MPDWPRLWRAWERDTLNKLGKCSRTPGAILRTGILEPPFSGTQLEKLSTSRTDLLRVTSELQQLSNGDQLTLNLVTRMGSSVTQFVEALKAMDEKLEKQQTVLQDRDQVLLRKMGTLAQQHEQSKVNERDARCLADINRDRMNEKYKQAKTSQAEAARHRREAARLRYNRSHKPGEIVAGIFTLGIYTGVKEIVHAVDQTTAKADEHSRDADQYSMQAARFAGQSVDAAILEQIEKWHAELLDKKIEDCQRQTSNISAAVQRVQSQRAAIRRMQPEVFSDTERIETFGTSVAKLRRLLEAPLEEQKPRVIEYTAKKILQFDLSKLDAEATKMWESQEKALMAQANSAKEVEHMEKMKQEREQAQQLAEQERIEFESGRKLGREVASGSYIYLRADIKSQAYYIAQTPRTGGYPEAALSSNTKKRTRLQMTKLESSGKKAGGSGTIQLDDTVCLRCSSTLDNPSCEYLYGSSGGWAKYTQFDNSDRQMRWTIVPTSGKTGALCDGDTVNLRDNYYSAFLCANLDKTWQSDYYIEVESKSKRSSNPNASYAWVVELA